MMLRDGFYEKPEVTLRYVEVTPSGALVKVGRNR